jgi:hypothetical protein
MKKKFFINISLKFYRNILDKYFNEYKLRYYKPGITGTNSNKIIEKKLKN